MIEATHAPADRSGLLAGGNFVVDYVKVIDAYPQQDMLASIQSESSGNGGGPYNVLKDLSALGASFPLEAVGLVGRDASGRWILEDCTQCGINTTQLRYTDAAPTSYTDVMSVASTGRRTFFHQRGANAILGVDDFDFGQPDAKLFHFAYLLLLDNLDLLDADTGRTGASQVLERASQAGFSTSVDLVSIQHPDFVRIVDSALPHTDRLFLNEIEATALLGDNVPVDDSESMQQAAERVLQRGVRKEVILHSEAGAVAVSTSGRSSRLGSVALPDGHVQGTTGAGDAFAAGYLYGVHEDADLETCLSRGVCAAASCLSHPSTSNGILPLAECLRLAKSYGYRDF